MKITYVGHSCFLYENEDGGKIVFDPYKPGSVPGYADMDIAADEIVVSHGHADHSGDAYVDKAEPPYDGEFEIGVLKTYHDSKMGLIRGAVTPFGILANEEKDIIVFLDKDYENKIMGIHPCDNTATVFVNTRDVVKLLKEHGNEIHFIKM